MPTKKVRSMPEIFRHRCMGCTLDINRTQSRIELVLYGAGHEADRPMQRDKVASH